MRYRLLIATLIIAMAATQLVAQKNNDTRNDNTRNNDIGNNNALNASQRSYQQARRVLDDAIEAHGGLEALRGIKDFTLKEKSKIHARFQSPSAEPPFATGTSEETLIVDTERGRVFDDLKAANAGFNNWIRTVIKGTEGQTYDMWSKTVTPIVNASINNFRGQIRRLPPFVLLEALDRAPTLRYLGEDDFGGRKQSDQRYPP